jgi:hypothetical protein
MKVLHYHYMPAYWTSTAFLFLSLLSPKSLACDCMPGSLNGTLYNNPESTVITGRIMDELKLTTTSTGSPDQKYFTFKVKHVYKSCSVQPDDTIVVSTSASSALCGLTLEPDAQYVFSAHEAEPESMNLPSVFRLNVGLCNFHSKWPMGREVRQALRQYRDMENVVKCSSGITLSVVPLPCNTGAACDQTNEYCNTSINKCVSIASCPTPTVDCKVAPCTVTDPCQEAVGPLICIDDYCGGCNAIFLDANRTQVCNSP